MSHQNKRKIPQYHVIAETKRIVQWIEIVGSKIQCTNALSPPQKSQRNMFTLALLRAIGSSATTMKLCHSQIRDTKMTQPFQLFYSGLRNQQKKPLSLHGYLNISKWCFLCLSEKLLIATYPDQKQLLNKRSDLIANCRHGNTFLLINQKASD